MRLPHSDVYIGWNVDVDVVVGLLVSVGVDVYVDVWWLLVLVGWVVRLMLMLVLWLILVVVHSSSTIAVIPATTVVTASPTNIPSSTIPSS